MTDPINRLDASLLSDRDKIQLEQLQAAYDRGGPKAVAEGMSRLAKSHPRLFSWLIENLKD